MIEVTCEMMVAVRPKVSNYSDKKHRNNVEFAQVKLDGFRVTVMKDCLGCIVAQGKKENHTQKLRNNHPRLYKLISQLSRNTVVDCELYVPGKPATSVPTALNEGWETLELAAFAVPVISGFDKLIWTPTEATEWLRGMNFVVPEVHRVPTINDLEPYYLELARENKVEGYVLKDTNYGRMYKVKPQKTVDLVVMDWYEGSGKYSGFMGGVRGGVYNSAGELISVAKVGGGWSDDQRETLDEDDVMGKVMEVEYQSIAAQGSLQFPRFLRFRDDKPAEQCTSDQLE